MKWLCVGPLWRGSDAGGLFKALTRIDQRIQVVDEFYYLSLLHASVVGKFVGRLIRPLQIAQFNLVLKQQLVKYKPDVMLVYKGTFVKPQTLLFAKQQGVHVVNFYPDVSMFSHGKLIPKSIPHYHEIFTTKTYGIADIKRIFGYSNTFFVPHGFDPDIHRPLPLSDVELETYGCDVSFIGTWSEKKEQLLSKLQQALPNCKIKIWGGQWQKATSSHLVNAIQGYEVLGDLFAVAMQASKINLGILHEQVKGASSGDLITARTFHIPACGGFMLHERNEESVQYFQEDVECAFFETETEMIEKVSFYLSHNQERNQIREAGRERAWKEHSLTNRAQQVLNVVSQHIQTRNKPL